MTENPVTNEQGPVREAARTIWWMVLIRAVLLVILGIVALTAPGMALLAFVFVFGFYAILDGVTAIVLGIQARKTDASWGWVVTHGVISVLAGLVALFFPLTTVLAIFYLIAAWALVRGIMTIIQAVRTRATRTHWGWNLAGGVLDVLFGILLLIVNPVAGIVTLLWVLGVFAIVEGVVLAVLAFRVRSLAKAA